MQHRGENLSVVRIFSRNGGTKGVNLDVSPQTAAYRSVLTIDREQTKVARQAARHLVQLLRDKGDRKPARKLVEGMLRKGYCVAESRIPHAVEIVYKTLNKDKEAS